MAVLLCSRVLCFRVYVTLIILFQLEDEQVPLSGEDSDDVPEEAEEPLAPPAGQAPMQKQKHFYFADASFHLLFFSSILEIRCNEKG